MSALVLILMLGCLGAAQAATEVKMSGDAMIWAPFWSKANYSGWNATGTKTMDPVTIWERFRLKTDFIVNEGLKFRFGLRVMNRAWGNDTFTVDNPTTAIDVYQAFVQFKWPNTNVEFTVGQMDMDLPISADMLFGNPVLGITRATAFSVKAPVCDNFAIIASFMRLMDNNKDFDPTTTQVSDEMDAYLLSLPITVDGFKANPWALLGVFGKDGLNASKSVAVGISPRLYNQSLATNLLAPATFNAPNTFLRDNQQVYWWVGTTLAVTALDPFKFYGDIIYGQGSQSDRSMNKRGGLFFDVAAEYTGLDFMTPQVTFWYSTGEDGSIRNGSERMPALVDNWGPSASFLFCNQQVLTEGYMGLNPLGSTGFAVSLDKISFIADLKHRLTFTWATGTNSAKSIRQGNALNGNGNYFQMGRDLTTQESVYAINFDNQYNIYENLAFHVETGWSHGNFQTSVWSHRFTNQTRNGDAWKVALGLQYKF
jgi:hypothetical protein